MKETKGLKAFYLFQDMATAIDEQSIKLHHDHLHQKLNLLDFDHVQISDNRSFWHPTYCEIPNSRLLENKQQIDRVNIRNDKVQTFTIHQVPEFYLQLILY